MSGCYVKFKFSGDEKKVANQVHDSFVSRSAGLDDIYDALVIAMKQNVLSRPPVTPQMASNNDGVKFFISHT